MGALKEFVKEAVAKGRTHEYVLSQKEKTKKPFSSALISGVGGAAIFPTLRYLSNAIEFGKQPVSAKSFKVGKIKVPSWLVASAATGAIGFGLIPYIREHIKARKEAKRLDPQHKIKISGAPYTGTDLFKPPQFRKAMPKVPLRSLSTVSGWLRKRKSVGKAIAGALL